MCLFRFHSFYWHDISSQMHLQLVCPFCWNSFTRSSQQFKIFVYIFFVLYWCSLQHIYTRKFCYIGYIKTEQMPIYEFFWWTHFCQTPPGLCITTRVSAQPLMWNWFFILMQVKLIFARKVVHLASFWKWGFLELESGLLD